MSRNVRNIFAALMLFCYLFAVAGVDVHHCDDNGKSYLALPVLGLSCESVHPHEECTEECHGDDDDCCSDTIFRITISGDDLKAVSLAPLFQQMTASVIRPVIDLTEPVSPSISATESVSAPPGIILKKYCVLRV